jgi:hypothetical protein
VAVPIPAAETPKEERSTSSPIHLTRAQKLRRALAVCRKDRKKSKRLLCEKAAKKKFVPAAKKHKTAK